MPELPEVEAAGRLLERHLGDRCIRAVRAPARRIVRDSPRPLTGLTGARLARRLRRGKHLLLYFGNGLGLYVHLGMTGKWQVGAPQPVPAHARASLELADGTALHYIDPRRFGRLEVHPAADLAERAGLDRLGPDPLADGLDGATLARVLAGRRRPIKTALLDQHVVAGLGNIQVTEGLFRAGLHPARPAGGLTARERAALAAGLHAGLEETLAELEAEGIRYLSEGRGGGKVFRIYQRAGRPCPACGRRLEKTTLGGRGTVWCGRCQT